MATFTKLKSGSWRAQVRRKGRYVNDTFRRRKDAEDWALEVERRIDRGEPSLAASSREQRAFGDLIRLHREDLREVGKRIGRSKTASLAAGEPRSRSSCAPAYAEPPSVVLRFALDVAIPILPANHR